MRDVNEIGSFDDWGERTNLAYQTYASIYLDTVDGSIKHFFWRDKDVQPVRELEETNPNPTEKMIFDAYIKEAVDIANIRLDYEELEELYDKYPLLKEMTSICLVPRT